MSHRYRWVQWNRHKLVYDACLMSGVILFLTAFVAGGLVLAPGSAGITELLIRAMGVCALVLLHLVLVIGPMTRLDDRIAPLLYNRRHLGVAMFLLALGHGVLATLYFGGFGTQSPVTAVFVESGAWWPPTLWPFEFFGLMALCILFVMAGTSHDYWLKALTPRIWKAMHMGVYAAYVLLLAHVAFGAFQRNDGWIAPVLLGIGVIAVGGVHGLAAVVQSKRDTQARATLSGLEREEGVWIDAGAIGSIESTRAVKIVLPDGAEVAVFRDGDRVYAVGNSCPHQGGPLSEGQIVGGCITCPWHGYQFRPEDGRSPPPYTEVIETYPVRIVEDRVMVGVRAAPRATPLSVECGGQI